jgi:hypothetical protein
VHGRPVWTNSRPAAPGVAPADQRRPSLHAVAPLSPWPVPRGVPR